MTGWLIETLIATTLLMLAVLALREPVARHFGPRVAYLLWTIPAIRMVMPSLPEGSFASPMAKMQDAVVVLGGAAPLPAAASGTDWLLMTGLLWAAGAGSFFAWHAIAYLRFTRAVRATATPLFECDDISVEASGAVASPLAFGLFGKAVVLPSDFAERYDATEQRLAIDHEVTHHRRGDLAVNLVAMAMLALHWFNPVAHWAWRAFRLDQEAACDAIVLDGASADERHAYGSALFKSAAGAVPLAACTISAPATLKKRLRRILTGSATAERAKAGAALTGALLVGGLMLTASGGIAAEAARQVEAVGPIIALDGVVLDVEPVNAEIELATADREVRIVRRPVAPLPPVAPVAPAAPVPFEAPDAFVPPLPPEAPLAPAAPLAPVRKIVQIKAHGASCEGATATRVAVHDQIANGVHRRIAIVSCGVAMMPSKAKLAEALGHARARLVADAEISGISRDDVIASLDREITRLTADSIQ